MKLKLWKWEVELKRESAEEAAARDREEKILKLVRACEEWDKKVKK